MNEERSRLSKMKIQRVYVDGYRNLNNVDVSFVSITALASLNNFGKSNFLNAIDFGINLIKSSSKKRLKMLSDKDLMPMNLGGIGKNFVFKIEMVNNSNVVEYSLECKWDYDEEHEGKIVSEKLRIKNNQAHQKYETYITRHQEDATYKSSETSRCITKVNIDALDLVVNKLKSYDSLFYFNIIKKINEISIYMEDSLDPRRFYDPDPIVLKGFGDVMFKETNLPRVINKLKQIKPEKFGLIEEAYKILFPNVEELILQEVKLDNDKNPDLPEDFPYKVTDSVFFLKVKDKNMAKLIDFEAMSDGAKRILVLITRVILAEMSNVSLITIEEPENSIHPSLLNAYLQIIMQLLDDCKIVFTSHSPYLINYLESDGIYVGIPGEKGNATFKKLKKNKILKDSQEVSTNMGDYLFSILSTNDTILDRYVEE